MSEVFRGEVPAKYRNIEERAMARLPRVAQVVFDRASTTRRLSEGRDLILATNSDTGEWRSPFDYVAGELHRMYEGKVVTLIAYSGRNNSSDDEFHDPKIGRDFDIAADRAIRDLQQFHPKDFIPLHREKNKSLAIAEAEAFYAGGGNSSGHSANIMGYRNFDGTPIDNVAGANAEPLQYVLRRKIANGTPYGGMSAGQMIATANVIPHIDPPAHIYFQRTRLGEVRMSMPFDGLNLLGNFGLAVQPHYEANKPTNYGDETQFQRLKQVIERNPWLTILGLEDYTALKVQGRRMTLVGDGKAYMIGMDKEEKAVRSKELLQGADLSPLLDTDRTMSVRSRLKR